jgi:hydrogenase maturation protein HypF
VIAEPAVVCVRVRVEGTVQGVGFRPYVYRLAHDLGLRGYVLNDARGVLIEAEGSERAIQALLARLAPEAPPLAVLERVRSQRRPVAGHVDFQIRDSPRDGTAEAPVSPDAAVCHDCLRELFDPADRRFRYPYINCTNCGPRFTIVRGIPYDRPYTTMAGFEMCPACRAEYEDPYDRRFHAQPNACPICGPALELLSAGGDPAGWGSSADAVRAVAGALAGGAIVALKGIGGYHLACTADDEAVVARLRARKHREDKPFALMARDSEQAAALVHLDGPAAVMLGSVQAPIVLAPRVAGAPVAPSVAPGAPELGVMLPYSPLHHLLLADVGRPLVMTSGNTSDEPIAYRDDDACARLAAVADLLLVGNRPIETRTDDSVVRVVRAGGAWRRIFLRRSRGYVPADVPLPDPGTSRPLLACGAELKNTFCVAKGTRAWVSHHIGDLENYETLCSFVEGIEHFERLFAVAPEVVAHDLHPEYLSTKYALERDGVTAIGVQHHHAHLAACLAEHGELGKAVGAIFDGTGYGLDGGVWGGELLFGDLVGFERAGWLHSVPLPGGAQAIKQPWRMACAWLTAAGEGTDEPPGSLAGRVSPVLWEQVTRMIRTGLHAPPTTSMGRLFDAVGALCGLRTEINYEGQAAIELEAACDPRARGRYELELLTRDGRLVIDPRETIRSIQRDLSAGVEVGTVAARFHETVAAATVSACTAIAAERGADLVVLSGGVFANRRLLEAVSAGLAGAGLRVLTPNRLPIGDGGISYGQAAIAAAQLEAN